MVTLLDPDISEFTSSPLFEAIVSQSHYIASEIRQTYLIPAMSHIESGDLEAALEDCDKAEQTWPDLKDIFQFVRAHALTFLHRYDDAFSAFESSYEMFSSFHDALQRNPALAPYVSRQKEEFYKRWTLSGLMQGLVGLSDLDLKNLQEGGEKVVAVLRRAKKDGLEDSVWSIINEVEKAFPADMRHQMQELREFIELIAIEDPFEGLAAIAKRISKVWPKDIDCVQAVREQRR